MASTTAAPLSLNVLLLSDIHLRSDHITDLVSPWLRERDILVDLILCSGDLCNLKGDEYTDKEALEQAEKSIDAMLAEMEKICTKVYYIPGNHDPMSTFHGKEQRTLSQYAKNVHGKIVNDLVGDASLDLAGFGGSVPAFYRDTGDLKWKGYPYESEEAYAAAFSDLRYQLLQQGNESQTILMTHVGPSGLDTTLYHDSIDNPAILSGCKTLSDFLEQREIQDHVVGNVHGHTHPAHGSSNFCAIPVINPGSLKEGNFGLLEISRSKPAGRWTITERRLVHLDYQ